MPFVIQKGALYFRGFSWHGDHRGRDYRDEPKYGPLSWQTKRYADTSDVVLMPGERWVDVPLDEIHAAIRAARPAKRGVLERPESE